MHHYGVIMVINSRRETQILTVGPDQLWPARERGGGGVMPSCTDSTLTPQSGCIPTVHCSAGSGRVPAHCALTTGPSSGPSAQSVAVRAWPQQHRVWPAVSSFTPNLLRTFVRKLWSGQVTALPGAPRGQLSVECGPPPR